MNPGNVGNTEPAARGGPAGDPPGDPGAERRASRSAGPSGAPDPARPGRARPRIGLYGGSVDPLHEGHLHAARAALAAFALERVVFVPAAEPPHKPGRRLASGADRLAMLALGTASEPRFEVSPIELERGGRSFTIDTVRALPAALGLPGADVHLILGSDNLPDFPRWRDARALAELVQPIVVHREGDADRRLEDLARELGPELGAKFARGYLRLAPVEVSSTELRAAAALGLEPGTRVPPEVARYIRERRLYGAAAG